MESGIQECHGLLYIGRDSVANPYQCEHTQYGRFCLVSIPETDQVIFVLVDIPHFVTAKFFLEPTG